MISVVVLTRNRWPVLCECLKSIFTGTLTRDYEVIVVDNASIDETHKGLLGLYGKPSVDGIWGLDLPRISVITMPDNRLGVCARNRGFDAAKGGLVAQIDDDVAVHQGWDETMVRYLTEGVGAVGPQGSYVCPDWSNFNHGWAAAGAYCDVLTGYCWLFKNEGWRYDESFAPFWHEEVDLQFRMHLEKGYRFRATPMICSHASKRTEIDWDQHNRNLATVVNRYKDRYVSELNRKQV